MYENYEGRIIEDTWKTEGVEFTFDIADWFSGDVKGFIKGKGENYVCHGIMLEYDEQGNEVWVPFNSVEQLKPYCTDFKCLLAEIEE